VSHNDVDDAVTLTGWIQTSKKTTQLKPGHRSSGRCCLLLGPRRGASNVTQTGKLSAAIQCTWRNPQERVCRVSQYHLQWTVVSSWSTRKNEFVVCHSDNDDAITLSVHMDCIHDISARQQQCRKRL